MAVSQDKELLKYVIRIMILTILEQAKEAFTDYTLAIEMDFPEYFIEEKRQRYEAMDRLIVYLNLSEYYDRYMQIS